MINRTVYGTVQQYINNINAPKWLRAAPVNIQCYPLGHPCLRDFRLGDAPTNF